MYQFRHPDITSNAHIVFALIGIALLFEVVGYYNDSGWFWILFILAYLGVLVLFAVHTYYNGTFSACRRAFAEMWTGVKVRRDRQVLQPRRRTKFILLLMVIAVNVCLAVFFIVMRKPGISRYLLVILIANMGIYVAYYCGMKAFWRRYYVN